jgi:hypothetical protein
MKSLYKKKQTKSLMTLIICFVVITCTFTVLTLLYGLIPSNLTEKNMLRSLDILDNEGNNVQFKDITGMDISFAGDGNKVDNFTNMWMIQSVDSEHFFDGNQFRKGKPYNPDNREYIEGNFAVKVFSSSWENGNYWSGYRLFFKPLMIFFDVWGLRIIQISLIIIALIWTFIKIRQEIGLIEAVLLIIAVLAVNPLNILFGFDQGPDLIQALFSIVTVLWMLRKKVEYKWVLSYFLFIGMFEIFINCLIMPLVTLGLPLITYLLYEHKKGTELKIQFKNTITFSFVWGVGYVGTFISSWIISALFKHISPIESVKRGIGAFVYRCGGNDDSIIKNISDSVHSNINHNVPFIWLIIIFLVFIFLISWMNHKTRKYLFRLLPLVFVSLYPFIWIILLNNHSLIHAWMVHDIFIVSIWGFLLNIYYLMNNDDIRLTLN